MIRRTHPLLMHIHEFFVECLWVSADMEIPNAKLTPCIDRGKTPLCCLVFLLRAVSRPGESHPQALSEPDVNLSAHPAPITQPQV